MEMMESDSSETEDLRFGCRGAVVAKGSLVGHDRVKI